MAPKGGQQGQRIRRDVEFQVLTNRQHEFLKSSIINQVHGLACRQAVPLLPGGAMHHPNGGARIDALAWLSFKQPCLVPEFLRQAAGGDATTQWPLQPQPAVLAVAAQLPAGQDRLHTRYGCSVRLQGGLEEAEGQQDPWTGVAGSLHRQCCFGFQFLQSRQARIGKPLGQFEAARATQFQAVRPTTGADAEARSSIPEEAEAVAAAFALFQPGEQCQGVAAQKGDGEAQQTVVLQPLATRHGDPEQLGEAAGCLYLFGTGGCQDGRLGSAAQMYGSFRSSCLRSPCLSPRSSQAVTPGGSFGRRRSSGRCMRSR